MVMDIVPAFMLPFLDSHRYCLASVLMRHAAQHDASPRKRSTPAPGCPQKDIGSRSCYLLRSDHTFHQTTSRWRTSLTSLCDCESANKRQLEIRTDTLFRSLLVVAPVASFAPQINLIKTDGDCTGISVFYVVFNLIVATYSFSLLLAAGIDWKGNFLFNQPPDARDSLNMAQFTVTMVGHLVL